MALSLDVQITVLVLFAAFLHASWNALVKAGGDPLLTIATVSAASMVLSGLLVPFTAAPAPPSWPYLALGVLTHNGFKIFLILAYRAGDLSQVYPLARGTAPLIVALFSGLAAGEYLRGPEYLGVALVSAGLASLTLETTRAGRMDAMAVGYALLTGVFIGAYTLIDGLGVRQSGSHLGYSARLFFLDGMPMLALALVLRGRALRRMVRVESLPALVAGSLSLFAYYVVLWALNLGTMAPIAALRETGVIFAALIGRVVLKEPFGARRVVAACLVAGGIALLHLGG